MTTVIYKPICSFHSHYPAMEIKMSIKDWNNNNKFSVQQNRPCNCATHNIGTRYRTIECHIKRIELVINYATVNKEIQCGDIDSYYFALVNMILNSGHQEYRGDKDKTMLKIEKN